jgi:hypothetical protein
MTSTAAVVPLHPESAALAQASPETALVEMTEQEFTGALKKIEVRRDRAMRLLRSVLVENVHYGKLEGKNGRPVFQKPILTQAGGEELRNFFGWRPVYVEPFETVVATAEFAMVTVHIGIVDRQGRTLAVRAGSCSSKEKRFKSRDGSGYVFSDAREVMHDLHALADKRALTLATREAAGLTAFLATEAEMQRAMDGVEEDEDDRPLQPWTDAEKKKVYAAAQEKGLGKAGFLKLIEVTLGRTQVGTGADVEKLLAAIASYVQGKEVKVETPDAATADALKKMAEANPNPYDLEPSEATDAEPAPRAAAPAIPPDAEQTTRPGEATDELPLGDTRTRKPRTRMEE